MVTLDGELLEMSGAMTGGSLPQRQGSLHFGRVESGESEEAIALRERLQVIDQILDRGEGAIAQAMVTIKTTTDALNDARQREQALQFTVKQLDSQVTTLQHTIDQTGAQTEQDQQLRQELVTALSAIEHQLPQQELDLQQKRTQLHELEQSQTHSEWQQAQGEIRETERTLHAKQTERQTAEQQLQENVNQQRILTEKLDAENQRLQEHQAKQQTQQQQQIQIQAQLSTLEHAIQGLRHELATIEQTLATEKAERDRAEKALREQQEQHQQVSWSIQNVQERYESTVEEIAQGQKQLEATQLELPDPLPDIPEALTLEDLQKELRSLQRRLQAMEPVNMLALGGI